MKFKFTWRIWLLIFILIISLISIFGAYPPKFLQKGVLITSVESNSSAYDVGLKKGEIITKINNVKINDLEDFTKTISEIFPSEEKIKTTIYTNNNEFIFYSNQAPKITVENIPNTNIKTGLDLSGGARALVQAKDEKLSSSEINDLINVLSNRLNVHGISDMNILPVSDLTGNNYILIEIAGTTPEDLKSLISQQGKFEAKIKEDIVFIGGEKDITSVCRNDATCARVETCQQSQEGGYYCNFRFSVYLSQKAAERHAELTSQLDVNTSSQGNYLSEKLDLYLDDVLKSSLLISEGLKGSKTTQISISGSGSGKTNEEAITETQKEMRELQTILITGSLPYQLEIVKLDTISPTLGKEFINSILLAGLAAILAISLVVFLRYRKIKFTLSLLITSISEIIIILGIASAIKWNLDLPSIAGILATIGTGIDSQLIILDESKQQTSLSIKQKLKRAFAIILGAYFTALVALLPLLWAGAGLLKGFAVTTIIGISIGVLITRPAFTDIIKNLEE